MRVIATAKVVTSSKWRSRPKTAQLGNREWVSIIQGINSSGGAIPPLIILKGQNHLSALYKNSGLPRDWVITLSENGWTTNEIGYEWIQHFEKHTSRTIGNYRLFFLMATVSLINQFQQYYKNNIITFFKSINVLFRTGFLLVDPFPLAEQAYRDSDAHGPNSDGECNLDASHICDKDATQFVS